MTAKDFRRLALSFPEATERAHVRTEPKTFRPVQAQVILRTAKQAAVREALSVAWSNRAPRS